MIIKAELNKYRQAPRKVRLLAGLVKGKKVEDAIALVSFSGKRAADPIVKLIKSAVSNATHNFNLPADSLYVRNMRVDGGLVMKRGMPRAFGRSFLIKKRTSHVSLELESKEVVNKTEKLVKAEKKPVAKKKIVRKTIKK
jgi:large subunit ribosomal protein L22